MQFVKIFMPENRLSKVVESKDGVAFDQLVADADARIETMADDIRAYVDERVKEIAVIHEQGEVVIFGECLEISRAAMGIAELAGAAGQDALGQVARGICAMIDSLVDGGVWHSDALELHLTSLALLNSPTPPDAEESARMLGRLLEMRRIVGIAE